MDNWRSVCMPPQTPLIEALGVMNNGALQLGIVVDSNDQLQGLVTDGDVRRGLLQKIHMEAPVSTVMNRSPVTAKASDSREHNLALMRAMELEHIPLLDESGRVVGLEMLRELSQPASRDNWVVIMAGGLGTRLAPLTRDCPKPLLRIGSKPILEVILENFIQYGFHRFFFSVNYKKQMIQDHFGDGSDWGVNIQYLEEAAKLGTAGSLGLLPEEPKQPFFVMNGDLLTRINFSHILDFHKERKARATLCVRRVEQTIPYGVVEMDDHRLLGIEEKPVREYFVNAGIYLLDPGVLSLIPAGNGPIDMPNLFQRVIDNGEMATAFPFLDYWLDIGRMGDFHQACRDYPEVFQ
ncbi:MAG: nucleotidyltransferase family protein [Magnetococcales bacterium]|nr:nucleotidyltransferase family protein [Magnetococcales bacterium]